MLELRPPDAMPREWTIASFVREQGFGKLRHASGEESPFDIASWDLGSWKPSPEEERRMLDVDSPLLPRVGEPVRVAWRRSVTGRNVPHIVQPTGRTSAIVVEHTLTKWLRAMQAVGCFPALTKAKLKTILLRYDEEIADAWSDSSPHGAIDFACLLAALEDIARDDSDCRAQHASWIYHDDHRWDRDYAAARLPAMLNLQERKVLPAGDGYRTGREQSLLDYARECNAQAAAEGLPLRLHDVATGGDDIVLVALSPAAFQRIVSQELLRQGG